MCVCVCILPNFCCVLCLWGRDGRRESGSGEAGGEEKRDETPREKRDVVFLGQKYQILSGGFVAGILINKCI